MALTAIALAASLATGSCQWSPSTQPEFRGEPASTVERFQDIPPEMRARLRQRMAAHKFDELVLIRRDAIIGKQGYGEISGLQFGRTACEKTDRSAWAPAAEETALSYCEGDYCVLVTINGHHVLRVERQYAGDPQETLRRQPPAAGEPVHAPGRLLVGARAGLSEAQVAGVVKGHGAKARRIGRSDLYIVDLPSQGSERSIQALLAKNPHFKFAELDQRVTPALAV
ncbi:MAG TPA: MHFG family PEP-CTERM protein, partial [Roseateles sp.]|nr:MHFG family PEP-CTERM protein [Roseateles sp.]